MGGILLLVSGGNRQILSRWLTAETEHTVVPGGRERIEEEVFDLW